MGEYTRDQDATDIDPDRIRAVLDMTRAWWGLGEARRMRQLDRLAPQALQRALQAGEGVAWAGWSIRAMPAYCGGDAATGGFILAVSVHGLVRADSAAQACQRIRAAGHRQSLLAGAGEPDGPSWDGDD